MPTIKTLVSFSNSTVDGNKWNRENWEKHNVAQQLEGPFVVDGNPHFVFRGDQVQFVLKIGSITSLPMGRPGKVMSVTTIKETDKWYWVFEAERVAPPKQETTATTKTMTSLLTWSQQRIVLSTDLLNFIKDIFEKNESMERIHITELKPVDDMVQEVQWICAGHGHFYIYRKDAFELDSANHRKAFVKKLTENPIALIEALSDETRIPAAEVFKDAYAEANEKLRQLANPPTIPEHLPEEVKYVVSRLFWMAEQYAQHSSVERDLLKRCKARLISHLE